MDTTTLQTSTEILARVIGPENPGFNPDVALSVLDLKFPAGDISRMNELAAKSRDGSISEAEAEQLNGYLLVGSMLDLLHSKARISLKKSSV